MSVSSRPNPVVRIVTIVTALVGLLVAVAGALVASQVNLQKDGLWKFVLVVGPVVLTWAGSVVAAQKAKEQVTPTESPAKEINGRLIPLIPDPTAVRIQDVYPPRFKEEQAGD